MNKNWKLYLVIWRRWRSKELKMGRNVIHGDKNLFTLNMLSINPIYLGYLITRFVIFLHVCFFFLFLFWLLLLFNLITRVLPIFNYKNLFYFLICLYKNNNHWKFIHKWRGCCLNLFPCIGLVILTFCVFFFLKELFVSWVRIYE